MPPLPSASWHPGTIFDNNWLAAADMWSTVEGLGTFLGATLAPSVDLRREIVVAVGFYTGTGPICGQVRLTGVTFDHGENLVLVELEDAAGFETLPPAPDGAVAACAAVGVPAVVVLALDRSLLPSGFFRLRLEQSPGSRAVEMGGGVSGGIL